MASLCESMSNSEGHLLQRRNINRENMNSNDVEKIWDENVTERLDDDNCYNKEPRFTLMEEVLLMGLKEEGYTSFWNDCISRGLRGCILIELGLRGRIELERVGMKRKSLINRKILVKNDTPTGDTLLDETLKLMKEAEPDNVQNWLEYLSGETWNPLKLRYHLKNVKERLAKNLVDKGVLTTDKKNFLLFDMTTHPIADNDIKTRVIKKIQEAVLVKWSNDPQRMDPRLLSLVIMCRASDVLESAFASLHDEDYDLAMKRIRELDDMDMEYEGARSTDMEIKWAIFASFSENCSVI